MAYKKGVEPVQVGQVFKSGTGTYTVLERQDSKNVLVRFLDTGYMVTAQEGHVKRGNVRDPLYPCVAGVGYIGVGAYSNKDKKAYSVWHNMINRCYRDLTHRCYEDAYVDKIWHDFQNFAEWFYNQPASSAGYEVHLDKDLVNSSLKIYCPENCNLVPAEINLTITGIRNSKGYSLRKDGKYSVMLEGKHLGLFSTPEEARGVYLKAKIFKLKTLATKYRNDLNLELYESLLNYKGYSP